MHYQPRITHQPSRFTFYVSRVSFFCLLALALAACGEIVEPQAAAPQPSASAQPQGQERLKNGNFDGDLKDWSRSKTESESVQSVEPKVGPNYAYNGQGKGVHFETETGTAAISALEQEFAPSPAFTLSFWVRPQRGSSRIGVSADGSSSNVNVSRLVFIDAGEQTASIVVTVWELNYVLHVPVDPGKWLQVSIAVDSTAGTQVLRVGDNPAITFDVLQKDRPIAKYIVFGDRQPRSDAYTIPLTNVLVKDGLNGSYDYANVSVMATR